MRAEMNSSCCIRSIIDGTCIYVSFEAGLTFEGVTIEGVALTSMPILQTFMATALLVIKEIL